LTLVERVGADRRWRLNLVRTRAQKSAFELDRTKAVANVRKQGILLADAALVLEEERAITLHEEAQNEQQTVGHHRNGRVGAGSDRRLSLPGRQYPDPQLMKQEFDFTRGKRRAVVPKPLGKTRVTIRLDDDVLDWFRDEVDQAGGGHDQTLIHTALRELIGRKREPLESTLRRILREERERAG
jgi:uncharacterized protein (DUF4415 family)